MKAVLTLAVLSLLLFGAFPAVALEGEVLYGQALSASREGDFVRALPLWNSVLEVLPEDPAALSNRGNVRLALGDATGAIDDQSRAIALAPEEADPHLNRGTAEEALQDWSAAAADYLWILDRDPMEASALYNLGNVRGSEGDWAEARSLYGRASEGRPGVALARSSDARAAGQEGAPACAHRARAAAVERRGSQQIRCGQRGPTPDLQLPGAGSVAIVKSGGGGPVALRCTGRSALPQQSAEGSTGIGEQGITPDQFAQLRLGPDLVTLLPGRQCLTGTGHGESRPGL